MNKFEKRFVRMMAMVALMIGGIMFSFKASNKVKLTVLSVLLVVYFLIYRFYWNYLERMELLEESGLIVNK